MSIILTKLLNIFTQPQVNIHISPSLKALLLDMLLISGLVIVLSAGLLNALKAPPENPTIIIYMLMLVLVLSFYLFSRTKKSIHSIYITFLIASWLIVTAISILYQQVAISAYLSLTLSTTLLINACAGLIAGLVNVMVVLCLTLLHHGLAPELKTDRDIFFLVINIVNIMLIYSIGHFVIREISQRITQTQQEGQRLYNETKHQLKKLSKEYLSVINTLSEAVIVTDMQLNITKWNDAAKNIYGYTEEEVLGKKLTDAIPTIFSDETNQTTIRQRHIERGLWQNEIIQKRKDEALIHALSSMSLLYDPDNKPIGAITINQEITNYAQVEKELHRLNKKNLAMEALLQDIITLISEDGRKQLNVLRSHAQTLTYKLTEQIVSEQIKNSINLLEQLLNIIVTINKTHQQIQMGNSIKLDIKQLVKEAFELYSPIAEQKGLKFSLTIEDHLFPLTVKGDEKLIMKVINYQLNNAIHFTSSGGIIEVSVGANNQQVFFTVSDTGSGIPNAHHEAVFHPYFNYRYQYTTDMLGIGLSLYTVKNIIIHYNGALIFESEVGKGSLFGFSLPHIIQTVL
jgi:PAS domain S-box-containing protein